MICLKHTGAYSESAKNGQESQSIQIPSNGLAKIEKVAFPCHELPRGILPEDFSKFVSTHSLSTSIDWSELV